MNTCMDIFWWFLETVIERCTFFIGSSAQCLFPVAGEIVMIKSNTVLFNACKIILFNSIFVYWLRLTKLVVANFFLKEEYFKKILKHLYITLWLCYIELLHLNTATSVEHLLCRIHFFLEHISGCFCFQFNT